MNYNKSKINYAVRKHLSEKWDIKPKTLFKRMEQSATHMVMQCTESKATFMLVPAHESGLDISKAVVETAVSVMDKFEINYPVFIFNVDTDS